MLNKKAPTEEKPNKSNLLKDVVVEMPTGEVITSKTILKALHNENINRLWFCVVISVFLFCPILCCIFFYNETFRWYYLILPLVFFVCGISMFCSLISYFVKTRKRKESILRGDLIVERSNICCVYSEYNNSAESDEYFIKIDSKPKNWIKVDEQIYDAVKRNKMCYMLYLPEDGQNVLFLVYIGTCVFDKVIL